mmetsp:Transcript_3521/g.8976  ORF Transcript_3521/g.8976 Transcript_3521/m.8976 type:complete len:307 (+) Transcript_3521:92-1012(+)
MNLYRLLHLATTAAASIPATAAFSAAPSLQSLLATNQAGVASLKEIARSISSDEAVAPADDVFYLRYVLNDYADDDERVSALKSTIEWRAGEGNAIVSSARDAIKSATASADGKWDNGPVMSAAPHSAKVTEFLSTQQCITTTLPSTKDLFYCVRAGKIDDNGLMSAVAIDEMVEFFLYCKEVNAAVADMRSVETDSLVMIITGNDLQGVPLVGGSADFRKALSASSKLATKYYPSVNGRTLMLNLPKLLGALVKLFTPLFPKVVRKRLRFESGPLKDVEDLKDISEGGKGRDAFVSQVTALAYDD